MHRLRCILNVSFMRVTAVIPAFNCETTIGSVVRACLCYCNNVVVIDDGSEDKTYEVALRTGATVLKLEENNGKAHALKRGIDFAMLTGFDALVTIDADGEHDPDDIPSLIKPIHMSGHSVVFGVRNKTHGSGVVGKIRPTQSILIHHFGINLKDAMCGFRAYSFSGIYQLQKHLQVKRFGIDFELGVLTILLKLPYTEIDISTANLKEYGGIRASHFDGLTENLSRFSAQHNYRKKFNVSWLTDIKKRENFLLPIGDGGYGFYYSPLDGLYYRR